MQCFSNFLILFNNIDVVQTLKACKNWLNFTTIEGFMCWSVVANCPIVPTFVYKNQQIQSFIILPKPADLLYKIRKDMVGKPSIVSARKTVVENFLFGNERTCASLLLVLMLVSSILTQRVSQCWLFYRWEYDSENQRFTPRQYKSSFSENVFHIFNELDQL